MGYEKFAEELLAGVPSDDSRFYNSRIIDAVASMDDATTADEQARNLKTLRRSTWLYELQSEGLPEMEQTRAYNMGVKACIDLLRKHAIGYKDATRAFTCYCDLEAKRMFNITDSSGNAS
ncbi:MAG: hypothetical protein AABX14_03040 [Candidatus Aenigmatarchaeota archaeon]